MATFKFSTTTVVSVTAKTEEEARDKLFEVVCNSLGDFDWDLDSEEKDDDSDEDGDDE